MNPPLLEAVLHLNFKRIPLSRERLQYFLRMSSDVLVASTMVGNDEEFLFESIDHATMLSVNGEHIELRSTEGRSYPRLREKWTTILNSLLDILEITIFSEVSLSYLNEIPLQELKSFRDYLNIGVEMPALLKERIALFRTEFTFLSDFGEVKVWIQPEWDDTTEGYSVQLIFESTIRDSVSAADLPGVAQQLHNGIKDVFHQIVSQDYIRQLPQ